MSLPRLAVLVVGALVAGTATAPISRAQVGSPGPALDPEKVVTAERCNACHGSEFEVWKTTPHARGFKTRHRTDRAREIADKIGEKLIKRGSVCIQCHYTPEISGSGKLKATSGVSCENCHGAARDWINIHNNYGEGQTRDTESDEHRAERIRSAKQNGMRRPSELYGVVANCYQCHTVPHERLVNVGGHASGSSFELVEWSDRIRHNFLDSFLHGDGTVNAAPSDAHRRVMYVVGLTLDLEYALRGLAQATEDGTYLKAMHRRSRQAGRKLSAIQSHVPELRDALTAAKSVSVAPNRRDAFLGAAEQVAGVAKRIIAAHDGSQLAALDPIIRGEAAGGDAPPPEEPGTTTGAATTPAATSASEARASASLPQLPGTARAHLEDTHPAPKHRPIGATECIKCHAPQSDWWFDDRHSRAADRFLEESSRAVQIAQLYGVSASAMQTRGAVCMDCHAGRDAFDPADGVSCESCHGHGADFKEPHQKKDRQLARQLAHQAGMVNLKDLTRRAENCARCHYITDERLLAAGHTSGESWEFARGNEVIYHWKAPLANPGQLQAAYAETLGKRGAVPKVEVVKITPAVSQAVAKVEAQQPSNSRPSRPGKPPRPPKSRQTRIKLPPFPAISDSTTIDEALLILKERLKLLTTELEKGS